MYYQIFKFSVTKYIQLLSTDNGSNLVKAIKIISSENGEYEAIEFDKHDDEETWGENSNKIELVIEDEEFTQGLNDF